MWTYRPAGQPVPTKPLSDLTPGHSASSPWNRVPSNGSQTAISHTPADRRADPRQTPVTPISDRRVYGKAAGRRSAILRSCCGMGALYLVGMAAGALGCGLLDEPLDTYLHYYTQIHLDLRTAGNAPMVFSMEFLSLLCQLTALLLSGFCVLGVGLVPIILLLKGAGTGIFIACIVSQTGIAKGVMLYTLLLWLPEFAGALLVILMGTFALRVASGLLRSCLGQTPQTLRQSARNLLHRYWVLCFFAIWVCGSAALLSLVFGRLF